MKFTEEQNLRLHEAIRRDAKASVQAFIHEAAMVALLESEKRHRDDEEYRERRKLEKKSKKPSIDPTVGLGVRDHAAQVEAPIIEPPPPPAPQIVIHNAPPANADADLDSLATYIRTGAQWDRPGRLSSASDVVAATSATPEEKARRMKLLNEKIATLEGKEKVTSSFFDIFDGLLK